LGNSLRQTVHTHRACVHQAAKLVAALLRVARVTAGLAESNGNLPSGLLFTSLPRTGISSGTLRSVIEYELPFTFLLTPHLLTVTAKPNPNHGVSGGHMSDRRDSERENFGVQYRVVGWWRSDVARLHSVQCIRGTLAGPISEQSWIGDG